MSDIANTVAAWTGAVGVVLTWAANVVSFALKRRSRIEVQLLEGPALTVVNEGAAPLDVQPPTWGGEWLTLREQEGTRYIRDSKGGYFRLEPGAERTFAFSPDRDSIGGCTIKPETVSRLLEGGDKPLCIYRRDGKLLHKVACQDIKELLRKRLNKA